MTKKLIGIVASPRRNGNCEMLLKEVLLSGEKDWEKEIIFLHELDIRPCGACYRCLPKGQSCILNDDFNLVINKLKAADGIVLATPCYILGPNGVFKNFMDRLISMGTEGERFIGKPFIGITTYGIAQWHGFGHGFTNLFAHFLLLDIKDSFQVKASYPGEFIKDPGLLEKLKEAGKNIFHPRSVNDARDTFACIVCSNQYLELKVNGQVFCPMCGSIGHLKPKEGGYSVEMEPATLERFTPEGMKHHFQDIIPETAKEFLARKKEIKALQQEYRERWKNTKTN